MERIIISTLNGTELLRTLAAHGVNTLGLRIMTPLELARTALMRSGISVVKEFLARKDEAALIDTFIRQTAYFQSASFADAQNMAAALFSLRSMIRENEAGTIIDKFTDGEFADKNRAMAEVYGNYFAALDEHGLIDTIGMMRKAVEEASPLTCEVIALAETELSPLEQALVEHVTAADCESLRQESDVELSAEKKYREISLPELFGTAENAVIRDIAYLESYGADNEVEAILSEIVKKEIPFDRCTVAVAETSEYAQLFYEYSQMHEIDMTFGCGIPITNSYPARLLRALYDWDTDGYHGPAALHEVIYSEATDVYKLMEAIGIESFRDLRCLEEILGNIKADRNTDRTAKKLDDLTVVLDAWMEENSVGVQDHRYHNVNDKLRLMDAAMKLGIELGKGYSYFIKNYALIRMEPVGRIDRAALNVICSEIDAYVAFSGKTDIGEQVPEILRKTVCSEPSREGALFITGISGAAASLRSHLYVAGLSADNYPGKPSENYLLLDSDYEMFGEDMPTSVNRIRTKKQSLKDLVKLACSFNIPVKLSYSDYRAAEMSAANPSSVLFEIYREEHGSEADTEGFEKAFKHMGYFSNEASYANVIGHAYMEGHKLSYDEISEEDLPFVVEKTEKGYAPTKLEKYFECPRKFLLENVLGIEDEDPVDPFCVVDGKQFGTLAHGVMEWLARSTVRPSRQDFIEKAAKSFDDFLKEVVPLNEEAAQREKKRFLDVMGYAYDLDPDNEVLSAEEKKTVEHESGIRVYGYPDRVEKDSDGNYLIADFKTARKIEHSQDDIGSCLQVVIYAYMMEKLGTPISYGEYRYLRKRRQVQCRFDDDMKEQLNAKLTAFRKALETGDFPVNTGGKEKPNCKYCKLMDICGRDEEEV